MIEVFISKLPMLEIVKKYVFQTAAEAMYVTKKKSKARTIGTAKKPLNYNRLPPKMRASANVCHTIVTYALSAL